MPDGQKVSLYTLKNANGVEACVTDLGATLVSVRVPDRDGGFADILHGFDTAEEYFANCSTYFGATVGRFGNRIAGGQFSLDGKTYPLATNNSPGGKPCHLHGGVRGFDKKLWSVLRSSPSSITFGCVSPDGEEGYPGNLGVEVTYSLDDDNVLGWEAMATTDKPTVINIIHHPYWNLSGDATKTINDHVLTLHSDRYLPTDAGLIPTGELSSVEGTPMDFRKPVAVGARIEDKFASLELAGGYDHGWILPGGDASAMTAAARVEHPKSGRVMEVGTNQPAIQFYAGNVLDGTVRGKGGVVYQRRTALCLETEGFPDAPNQAHFPSAVLRPGETYRHRATYKFSVQ